MELLAFTEERDSFRNSVAEAQETLEGWEQDADGAASVLNESLDQIPTCLAASGLLFRYSMSARP